MKKSNICNKCGKILDLWDMQENFSLEKTYLGYGTKYDTCELNIKLCCSCMDELIDSCKVSPIVEREDVVL